jgi:L-ascorbate metabolism protein UlaG (beta-lactamase superfamily)
LKNAGKYPDDGKEDSMNTIIITWLALLTAGVHSAGESKFEKDVFKTPSGKLTITFIGHGTLMFDFKGTIIHIDPWGKLADYTALPKADIILITHHHQDHLDTGAIALLSTSNTRLILTADAYAVLQKGTVMKNGDTLTIGDIRVEAVPAYNTTPGREKFHPKGRDNGYILTIGKKRIYIAGDTENIPEMASFQNIDIAFLPMNQPYTMLPAQVAEAVKVLRPKILYPYHYGETDPAILKKLLAGDKNTEVRIRPMK